VPPDELDDLADAVEKDEGAVLGRYRDSVGSRPLLLVSLPIDRVEPTPYQRDPSDPHVKRLMGVIEKIGMFLDLIIIVRQDDGFWTPNGNHRLQALKKLGQPAVSAVVEKLKKKGLTSPYLRSFVVSRVNYTRFSKAPTIDFDEAFDKITASAEKFNIDRVRQEDVVKAGGGPPDEEE